jgi:hypothetical protein
LEEREECVMDVVVKGRLAWRPRTHKRKGSVVPVAVNICFAERTWWGVWSVKDGESNFMVYQEAVNVRREAMVFETAGKGVNGECQWSGRGEMVGYPRWC